MSGMNPEMLQERHTSCICVEGECEGKGGHRYAGICDSNKSGLRAL